MTGWPLGGLGASASAGHAAGPVPPDIVAPTCGGGCPPPPPLWVSLNQTECHRGILGTSSSLGVATGAFILSRRQCFARHPQEGISFPGPSWSHGKYLPSRDTPWWCAHASKCFRGGSGTPCGSTLESMNGVVCCQSRYMRGCGRWWGHGHDWQCQSPAIEAEGDFVDHRERCHYLVCGEISPGGEDEEW